MSLLCSRFNLRPSLSCSSFSTRFYQSDDAPKKIKPMRMRERYPLTDRQLCTLGGKVEIQLRLSELGLPTTGFLNVLRKRLTLYLDNHYPGVPMDPAKVRFINRHPLGIRTEEEFQNMKKKELNALGLQEE